MKLGRHELYIERHPALGGHKRRVAWSWLPYWHKAGCGCLLIGWLCFGLTRFGNYCLEKYGEDTT